MNDDEPLTPLEQALVRALVKAIVKELREEEAKPAEEPPPPGRPTDLFTTEEAAVYLRANRKTMDHWRTSGIGPEFVKMGRRVCYQRQALDAYVEKQKRKHTNQTEE